MYDAKYSEASVDFMIQASIDFMSSYALQESKLQVRAEEAAASARVSLKKLKDLLRVLSAHSSRPCLSLANDSVAQS